MYRPHRRPAEDNGVLANGNAAPLPKGNSMTGNADDTLKHLPEFVAQLRDDHGPVRPRMERAADAIEALIAQRDLALSCIRQVREIPRVQIQPLGEDVSGYYADGFLLDEALSIDSYEDDQSWLEAQN